jgi:hypothetical protein
MADQLLRFKPITAEDVFKGIDKSYSSAKVAYGGPFSGAAGANEMLTWYYVDRGSSNWSTNSDDLKNLFHSFGIAREDDDDWFKVFNVADWFNAKRMIVATIPQSGCGSYIDGSTVALRIPTGVTQDAFITLYGSTYNGYPDPITGRQMAKEYEDTIYGGAYCYLFGATNNTLNVGKLPVSAYGMYGTNHPYTGNVDGNVNPNAGIRDWDPDEAVTSNTLSTAVAAKSPHYAATHWEHGDTGRDVPYGIAFLEKGIFVVFDMYGRNDLIVNCPLSGTGMWTANTATFSATTSSGAAAINTNIINRKTIHFEGSSVIGGSAALYYRTVTQSYKMIYFCHAGQNEFNSSSNHTYNQKKAYYRPEEASSLWITEIGLYDENSTMLAYAKLSQPVEKNKLETLTFKVELEL